MKPKCPVPKTLQSWLTEIATGYNDALEALPFAELMGQKASEKDLFQLAPSICLKLRGLPKTKKLEAKAKEAALSTYVATESHYPEVLANPHIAFALAYLASHYGLDLLTENEVAEIMDSIAQEQRQLAVKIKMLHSQ
jgi:hypothetical protein